MSLTVATVKQKLRGYTYVDMAATDIYSLCSNFNALKPQSQSSFVHSNGSTESCISITGTIPVSIRGQVYNIPITVWVRPKHPQVGPLVFVTPTQSMGIIQSQYVDSNGKVYLPFLSEWKKGSSDLSTLVQIMCATFVDNCPVYSKQAAPPPRPSNPRFPAAQRPQATTYNQPPRTGGNYGNSRMPYPQQQQPQPQRNYSGGYTPYPTGGSPGMPTPQQTGYRPSPYPVSTATTPYPTSTSSYPQAQPTSSQAHQNFYAPTSSINPVATAAAVGLSAEEEKRKHEETMRIKRQSLETAVEDRIRRQVTQVINSGQVEMNGLLQTQEELQQGSKKINAMLQEMDDKTREVEGSVEFLQSKNAELESMLEYLRAQPDQVDVDEAVQATNPLYNQILQLYAEENAIEDTIYYLGEALRKDVIELEVFLKHVRELSRQQFMARATIMKARLHAGLPDHGSTG